MSRIAALCALYIPVSCVAVDFCAMIDRYTSMVSSNEIRNKCLEEGVWRGCGGGVNAFDNITH